MTTNGVSGASVLANASFSRIDNSQSSGGFGRVINEGVNGIRNASADLLASANTISRASAASESQLAGLISEQDLTEAVVQQREAQVLFNASAEVVSVGNEQAGRLIDEIV